MPRIDAEVVGGVGLSSGTPAQDAECAQAGVDLFLRLSKSLFERPVI
ncbi:heme-binding protein [Rhizobium sp. BK377]|nr:heme-binding protein [Rhizobium sp. BK377]MBB3464246.1 uncharacterized protein GlcG (DUF336 family) [Rhizobium sp. BK377]